MSRSVYVYDKASGKMVPKREVVCDPGVRIIPDLDPYQVVGPEFGKVISSRSKHREYLRRHGLIEVGDQKPKWMRND